MRAFTEACGLNWFTLLLLPFLATPAFAECVEWPVNNHCYEAVYQSGASWDYAQELCEAEGGYLATITSAEENDFVKSLFEDDASFWFVDGYNNALGPWIGGYQPDGSSEPDANWHWSTGEGWTFTDWSPGQPDNSVGGQELLRYFRPGSTGVVGWDDCERGNPSSHRRGYILEIGEIVESETISWGALKVRY